MDWLRRNPEAGEALLREELARRTMATVLMGRVQAIEYAGKLTALGFRVTVRPRSWNQARGTDFWALEIQKADFQDTLYSVQEADATVGRFTPPIEVTGKLTDNLGFEFHVVEQTKYNYAERIPSPNQDRQTSYRTPPVNYTWNLGDIRRLNGVVTHNGKRYKLLPPANLFNHADGGVETGKR